ncbi:MAG: arylesterase [Xanthobacteraceae bacterium]|jgi:acyl-CoA thioesterase-1
MSDGCVPRWREATSARASYWDCGVAVHLPALLVVLIGCVPAKAQLPAIADSPVRIVALGDSLTAGLGLPVNASFPAKLETALRQRGVAVEITNAGVSGDTASGGLARLDWSVPQGTDAVIVELGANDMLRGMDPKITRAAFAEIVRRLRERHIAVLLAGMRVAPNLGAEYAHQFESIYSDLAAKDGVLLYPFFLDGVAGDPTLNQPDGIHPTAAGVEEIVTRMLPQVEELVSRVRMKRPI